MAKSRLEELADQYRVDNIKGNTYQKDKEYGATHKNAKGDGDPKGKGTGEYLDTYNGGSDVDINGNGVDSKTGRNALLGINESKNDNPNGVKGYGPDKPYTTPDLEGEDQFTTN